MALNVTTAVFGEGCNTATASPSLAQWDTEQVLQISGIDLPDSYKVEFSTVYTRNAIPAIGDASGVAIPNVLLQRSAPITAYVVLYGENGGRNREYWITIHITPGQPPETTDPDPEQADVIDQAIAALNNGVARTEAAATSAEGSANDAADHAEDAEAWAVGQRAGDDVPDTDPTYHNNSKYYAGRAEAAAEEAGRHEASWESWARRAETAAGNAEGSATAAGQSKAAAETAAQTAAQKATEAGNSAAAAAGSAESARQTVDGAIGAINTAKEGAVTQIGSAGSNAVASVNQAGTTQTGRVTTEGNTQVNRVQAKGDEVIGSIPQDYTDLVEDVADLSRQISDVEIDLDDNFYPRVGGNKLIGRKAFSFNDQWVDANSAKYEISIPANTNLAIRINADQTILPSFGLYVKDTNNTTKNLGLKMPNTDILFSLDYEITAIWIAYVVSRLTVDVEYKIYQVYDSIFALDTRADSIDGKIGSFKFADGASISWVQGYYINVTNGLEYASNTWSTTPFINVIGGLDYHIALANSSSNTGVVWFDKNKNFISGEALIFDHSYVGEMSAKAPQDACYMRFSTFTTTSADSYAKIDESLVDSILQINKDFRSNRIYWQLAMDKVLCIGDSLTSGAYYDGATYNGASIAQNYPYFLSRILNTEVTNAGVSGINVTEWLTNEYPKYTYTDYNTIIVWLGSNGGLLETLPENPTEGQTLAHNNYVSYRQLLTNLQTANPNALIIVCLIYFTNYWVNISNNALKEIAREYNVPVVDLSDLNAENYPDLRYIDENRYHLIKCGNIVVASRIADAMADWFSIDTKRCEFGLSSRIN